MIISSVFSSRNNFSAAIAACPQDSGSYRSANAFAMELCCNQGGRKGGQGGGREMQGEGGGLTVDWIDPKVGTVGGWGVGQERGDLSVDWIKCNMGRRGGGKG